MQNRVGDLVEDLASIGRYDNNSKMRAGYIVGRRNSGVCRDEKLELFALRSGQQLTIFERLPGHMDNSPGIVADKDMPQLDRQALIDEDAQITLRT